MYAIYARTRCLLITATRLRRTAGAVRQATGIAAVGLCHGAFRVLLEGGHWPPTRARRPDEVTSIAVGLNHLTFFYDLRHKGRDLMPVLREKVAKMLHDPANTDPSEGVPFPPKRATRLPIMALAATHSRGRCSRLMARIRPPMTAM